MTDNNTLLVCAHGVEKLKLLLSEGGVKDVSAVRSAGEARCALGAGGYALVVINAPLPDETGLELAMELTGASLSAVVLLVRAELMDMVNGPAVDAGVLLVGKPLIPQVFHQTLQLAAATRNRLMVLNAENEKLHKKLEELRIIDRAKCLLIEHGHITETEAHRAIEKRAMDERLPRIRVAKQILEQYEL